MPHRQAKKLQKDGERFDQWLIEAPESDFEEFVVEGPKELSGLSLELLRECKARVSARLDAEPEKKVFCMSDPHQIRLRYWYQIDERLEAEINWRSGKSAQAAKVSVKSARGGDPEVAKRRSIVKGNRTKSAEDLCKVFDLEGVPLPRNWEDDFSVKSWTDARRDPKLRHMIQSLICRDKKATATP